MTMHNDDDVRRLEAALALRLSAGEILDEVAPAIWRRGYTQGHDDFTTPITPTCNCTIGGDLMLPADCPVHGMHHRLSQQETDR